MAKQQVDDSDDDEPGGAYRPDPYGGDQPDLSEDDERALDEAWAKTHAENEAKAKAKAKQADKQ